MTTQTSGKTAPAGAIFSADGLQFLNKLARNNTRDWFKANQDEYENTLRTPALKFIEHMQPEIVAISPRLTAVSKKWVAA